MNREVMTISSERLEVMLKNTARETSAATVALLSSKLDLLIAHICKSEMNRTEIIELLGQESAKLHNSVTEIKMY
ncbi:Protein of uncharacterised function (DUF2732) [Enterobacter hormaechei]|uniref:DUF2732 family protein n=1 Tax=Enterobacter hormaechei TaxID=158836 RepID=UPI0007929BE2|nr:DUF2732 family protein [Enterobacter hormaechei]CZY44729.1 Protein of uncharacterised function (DUF2732) [Enterobacter hormaechei]